MPKSDSFPCRGMAVGEMKYLKAVDSDAPPTPQSLRAAIAASLPLRAPVAAENSSSITWTREALKLLLDDVGGGRLNRRDQRFVFDELDRLLEEGERTGLWVKPDLPTEGNARRPSRIRVEDGALIDQASRRRNQLVAECANLARCEDATVVAGAVLLSATLLGGVVHMAFLGQLLEIPGNTQRLDHFGDTVYVELFLQRPANARTRQTGTTTSESEAEGQEQGNIRRLLLEPITALLINHLMGLKHPRGGFKANDCLRAACAHLGWKACTEKELIKQARAWWTTKVPSFLYEYMTKPLLSPSLPRLAWARLLTGRSGPRRSILRQTPTATTAETVKPVALVKRQRPASLAQQKRGLLALSRILRVKSGDPLPSTPELLERLDGWSSEFESVGGWLVFLASWTRHVLSLGNLSRLKRPGLLRYLDGFSKRWIMAFHDLDPWAIAADPALDADEVADRLSALREDLVGLKSAGVARSGLTAFLRYVGAAGGPLIELDSEWRAVVSSGDVNANILTPLEYRLLQEWIASAQAGDEFNILRNQTLAILAYRLGPRWEELRTRQRRDLGLTSMTRGRLCGVLSIRPNAWFKGKNAQSSRRVPLEKFLATPELKVVEAYFQKLDQLGRSHPSDLLFADLEDRSRLPAEALTHDVIQQGMRIVSGDPSLVFHHLRHSAASFVFLRMFVDESKDPNALNWMHAHSEVSAAAMGVEGQSYAAFVLERSSRDGSRLQVLPRLLGHIDPVTGMHCYVHFTDVVLAQYVAKSAPHMPVKTQAQLDGVAAKSVRRRANRARKRDQNTKGLVHG